MHQTPRRSSVAATMTRDGGSGGGGEITAIFNPRRVRAPSVVVTGDSPNGQFPSFTSLLPANTAGGGPHLIHSDSIASGHPECMDQGFHHHGSSIGTPTPTNETTPVLIPIQTAVVQGAGPPNKCKDSCCSDQAQKVYYIVFSFRFLICNKILILTRFFCF